MNRLFQVSGLLLMTCLLAAQQSAQAQTPSCIKASYAGEPVQGVTSWNPYQVDPNNCMDTSNAIGTSHSVDTSGLEPGVQVSYQSAVPVTSITATVMGGGTCPLRRIFPSLSTLAGTSSGSFSLTFARDSGIPNLIGMTQVQVNITDSNGNVGLFDIYQYCRAPGN